MFTLFRNGHIYAPEEMGKLDILVAGGRIAAMGSGLCLPATVKGQVLDASGLTLTPGLVDSHIHILGAGGGHGPASRSGMVHLSTLIRAGVTSLVGVMGIDNIGFNLEELLMRARALEMEGLSTCILNGSYSAPPVTLTGSVVRDFYLIDKVIGVKTAIFEKLSSHPGPEALTEIISQAWLGGALGAKAGLTVAHVGDAPGRLADICDLLERLDVPTGAFVATHINRSPEILEAAAACGRRGMILDITGNISKKEMIPAHRVLPLLLEKGVPLENITFSSDSGAAFSFEGQKGILPVDICLTELREAFKNGQDVTEFLTPLTANPARIYKFPQKGRLAVGMDADILLFNQDFGLESVYAKGRLLFEKGRRLARGWTEEALMKNLEGAN